jgi:hypothetical protein
MDPMSHFLYHIEKLPIRKTEQRRKNHTLRVCVCVLLWQRELCRRKKRRTKSLAIKKSFDAIYGYPRSVDLVHENKRVAFNGSFKKKGKKDGRL